MKNLIITVALITLSLSANAQSRSLYSYTEIKKIQYDNCSKALYLATNSRIKKQNDKLIIPITGKSAKVFKDDSSDKNFHEFEYLGNIKGTKLSLIKRTDYNSEEFYIINRLNGFVDTLIGQPVFSQNMNDFACINNPGTDEKQQVQICQIKNGSVKTRAYLNGKTDTFLKDITCINQNSILAKDNKGKYWKLDFKIGDE